MTFIVRSLLLALTGWFSSYNKKLFDGFKSTKFIVIALLFLFVSANNLLAQVTTLNVWSNLYHGNSSSQQNLTYTVPTGTNSSRLLVVAIASVQTGVGARTVTLTYGNQTLTSVSGDMSSTTPRQHTQLYYLNEAGLDAAALVNTTLSVTVSGGTTLITDVFASVYDNANQVTPITNSQTYSSGTGTTNNPVFGTPLTVNSGDQAVEIISSVRAGNTTPRNITYAANWTIGNEQTSNTTDGVRNGVAYRSIPTTNSTDASSTTLSGATLASQTAMSIHYASKYFRSTTSGNWNSTLTWQQSYDNVTWTTASTVPTYYDNLVTIQSGHTVTLTAAASGSNVTVNGILDVNTFTLTGTGTLSISSTGTMLVGASNFPTGFATISLNTGSTVNYDNAGNQTVSAQTYSNLTLSASGAKTTTGAIVTGTLSIEGTATIGGTIPTWSGTAYTLQYKTSANRTVGTEWITPFAGSGGVIIANTAGTVTINNAKVFNANVPLTINTGGTLSTNNLQVTFGGDFHKSGTFTAGTSAIVIANTATTQSIDGFTTTGAVSMTKTAGTATFNGNVSGGVLTINGNGGTLNLGAGFTHTFTGWTRSAGTLAGNSSTVSFSGTISGTGAAFTPGTSTVSYTGAAQAIAAVNYYNLTLSGSGIPTLGAGTTSIGGNFTLGGTVSVTGVVGLTIGGDVVIGTGRTFTSGTLSHSVGGNWTNNGTFTPGLGTVTFTGTGKTIGGTANTTFYNLTINSASSITLNRPTTVNRVLTLTNGILTTDGTNLLNVTYTVTGAITGGSSTSFISGPVIWTLPTGLASGSSYIFPVGKGGYYYSFTLVNPTTGTGTVTARVEAFNSSSGGTFNSTLSSISSTEYWTLATTGNFTNSSLSVSRPNGISPLNVLAGNATAVNGVYASLLGTPGGFGVANSNSIGTNRFFVLAQGVPTITTSTASLSGFIYPQGTGPSTEQSFTISGNSLSTNITITPATDYEISTGTGASFVATNPITLTVSNGGVSLTTIYVRLKAGLTTALYNNETITASSGGATSKTITCNGSVGNSPSLTLTPTSRTGFTYVYTQGPSATQTFQVSGSNLVDTVYVTPPSDYEIAPPPGTAFQTTAIKLNQTKSSTLAATTITTRLKTGLGVGSHNQLIAVTSAGAVLKNDTLSGSVSPVATIYNGVSFLSGFSYTQGYGPSGNQKAIIKATSLTADVLVTPPANFEISKDGSTLWQSTGSTPGTITLFRNGTTLGSDTIFYVRMKSGLTSAGSPYGPLNSSILLSTTGATTKSISCTGTVVATNSPTITASKNTLTGFGYLYSISPAGGPSAPQSFVVSGASLSTNSLTVTIDSTTYEISKFSNTGYQSTAITLTGTSSGTTYTVAPTTIYVRLKQGNSARSYNALITLASNSTPSKTVSLVGKVFANPLILASGGGNFCVGSSINISSSGADIKSRYWTGPNSFYSSVQNPVVATNNSTTSMNGTYTVIGNVEVGGNLITNGDFESGNYSFGSGYAYVDTTNTQALYPEATYTVVKLPHSVHPNFSYWPDHTTGRGLQMVVNGSPTAGVVVWSQSVPVIPGATYQFTYWEQTVNVPEDPKNASQLQLYVNGVAAGPVYTAPLVNNQWQQFLYNASAGSNTVLNLELINQNTIASGNDFGLDDIVFQQILTATSTTDVTVYPNLPVSVVVDASVNPTYQNTPVTFTATPTNGGTAPTYQWQKNGVNVGTNSSVYTDTVSNGAVINCILTSNYPCPTGNPASDNVVMTVNKRINYWIGTTDTDWSKTSNWTANFIPQPGDDVEYATVANYGSTAVNDLWVDRNRTIGSLINATTKRLVVPPAKGIEVNNYVVTDGSVDRIYIQSSSTLANGSIHFNQPSQNTNVNATIDMYSRASWNLANAVNNKYKWQYFGIPVTSVTAYPTFSGSFVRKWDERGTNISNHWVQLANDSVLDPFYGYEICQAAPTTITFKGTLNTSDFNSGQLAVTASALYPGQHVFANSYTAGISVANLSFGTDTEYTAYLYNTGTYNEWLPDSGRINPGFSSGQYIAVPRNLVGQLTIPRQIASMQAVLIRPLTTTVSTPNFTFGIPYNSLVVDFDTAIHRVKRNFEKEFITDKICTIIDVKGSRSQDRLWLVTEPTCSHKFDNGWDGYKFIGPAISPQLYAIEPDGKYQINVVDDLYETQLGFQTGEDTEYTFTFTQENINQKYAGIYLVDRVENKTIDITQTGTTYTFTSATGTDEKRFKIVTRLDEPNAPDANSKVKIFSANGNIFVQNYSELSGNFILYDIAGHYLKNVPLVPNGIVTVYGVIPGAYISKVKTGNEEITKRLIVR